MKQEIENIIKKNLPEKKTKNSIKHFGGNGYFNQQGFNQAISSIDTSLIADEVLKVVVEKIKNYKPHIGEDGLLRRKGLLDYLSHNKENKNNG